MRIDLHLQGMPASINRLHDRVNVIVKLLREQDPLYVNEKGLVWPGFARSKITNR